jgi:hypothetical protein
MLLNQFFPFLLLLAPLAGVGYFYWKKRRQDSRVALQVLLNLLTFVLVLLAGELFISLIKACVGYDTYFINNNDNGHPIGRLVQGCAAALIFIGAVICLFLARRITYPSQWINLLLLNISFHGFGRSLPAFVTNTISGSSDTANAFTYLTINPAIGSMVVVACIVLIGLTGIKLIRADAFKPLASGF